MPRPRDGELDDEAVHLIQRGLYVEPLDYQLDGSSSPTNGHEYIHLVRQEAAAIFPEETKENFLVIVDDRVDRDNVVNTKHDINNWKKREAKIFSYMAIDLKSKREVLKQKHPKKRFPSVENEKEWCLFSLGTDMYLRIYESETIEATDIFPGSFPYLSIVLYLSQEEILSIITFMCRWSTLVGMNHTISRWIYGLLACLKKPVSNKCNRFLENFYDECFRRIRNCEENELYQLHLISSILFNYFCVKAYKIGTPLERFQKLV